MDGSVDIGDVGFMDSWDAWWEIWVERVDSVDITEEGWDSVCMAAVGEGQGGG